MEGIKTTILVLVAMVGICVGCWLGIKVNPGEPTNTTTTTSVTTPTETQKSQREIQQDIVNYAAEYDLYGPSNPRSAMAKGKLCDEFGELDSIPDQNFAQIYTRICG